ncbi:MAG: hypothetical protein KDB14_16705 [Planctomycetales bacterium]|nr:hypothetical protein [Planctomycetales bacterium]
MSWEWMRGHERQVEMFRSAISRGHLASTFLFIGPPGVGKRSFALELAASLLCLRNGEAQLSSCGQCEACIQVAALTHPDVILVTKPDDKMVLPIDLFVGDADHRHRTGLCHDISLKPYSGRRKIAIIDDADYFNQESANCLLKTLEEPPAHSLLIMLGTSEQRQLPTIRSRSQIIRFQPLNPGDIVALLQAEQPELDPTAARKAAEESEGSLTWARLFVDPETAEFRQLLTAALDDSRCDTVQLARDILGYVEAGGTDSPAKRARMRIVTRIAAMHYRQQLLAAVSGVGRLPAEEVVANHLEIAIDAEGQVDANANVSNWVEWFVDALNR